MCHAGLYYEQINNKLMQEMCFQAAVKCTEDPDNKTFLKMPTSQSSSLISKSQFSTKQPSNSSKISVLSSKPGVVGGPSAASFKGVPRDSSGDVITDGSGVKSSANMNMPNMLGVGGATVPDSPLVSGASGPPRRYVCGWGSAQLIPKLWLLEGYTN